MKCKSNRFCYLQMMESWTDIQGMRTCCVRPLGPQSLEDTEVSKSQRLHASRSTTSEPSRKEG